MQPPLTESYYLDNVITLFSHVENVYGDILNADHIDFLRLFTGLPENGKKLYVRLLNRRNEWFCLSKLNYPEINSIKRAVRSLQDSGLIQVSNTPDLENIIGLINKAELTKLHPEKKLLQKLGRRELDIFLLENRNDEFCRRLWEYDLFLKVLHKDIYLLMQMLFFGNLNQSMTDFVLRDLGLYQYESYTIDTDNRPYRSSREIQQHWLLYQLETSIHDSNMIDTTALIDWFAKVPIDIQQDSALYRKSERIKYSIARQIERLGELELALSLYKKCRLPPSRERSIRIHQQQGDSELAISECQAIINSPFDDSESQFAIEFSSRLIKRYRLPPRPGFIMSENYRPATLELELIQQESVELAVVEHYQHRITGQSCYYLENNLFNGVLGLLIWEAIFAPLAGAFYNPFQYRPSDFYAHDFIHKRQPIFDNIWSSIGSNDDIWIIVSQRWQNKQGLMNPLVNWQTLELEIIQLALQRIEYHHWLHIFRRILSDLRNNRAGFPDLVLFPPKGGYKLIEVKGPGDRLQKNQQRWMSFFADHNIPHELIRVSWLPKTDKGA